MLRLSKTCLQLHKECNQPFTEEFLSSFSVLPVSSFDYTMFGRTHSLQKMRSWPTLYLNLRSILMKSYIKRAKRYEDVQKVSSEIENISWLREINQHMSNHPEAQCRYITVEEPVNPDNISRMGFLIKKESSSQYYIMDIGSLNGIYIDSKKVKQNEWISLKEGHRIRFISTSECYKLFSKKQIDISLNIPSENDLHVEYVFTLKINEYQDEYDKQVQKLNPAVVFPTFNSVSSSLPFVNPSISSSSAAAAVSFVKRKRDETDQQENKLKKPNKLLENVKCSICLDLIYKCVVLNCGHSFCNSCIHHHLERNRECPECRAIITRPPVIHYSANSIIEELSKLLLNETELKEYQTKKQQTDKEEKAAK